MKQFNLKLEEEMYNRLEEIVREIAYKEGRRYSVTQLIRDILDIVQGELDKGKSLDEVFGGE